jgi:hypothetical protein
VIRAACHEGFRIGRQGVWLITMPSPWAEKSPLRWRIPLPDERSYRDAFIVPALDFLYGWMLDVAVAGAVLQGQTRQA